MLKFSSSLILICFLGIVNIAEGQEKSKKYQKDWAESYSIALEQNLRGNLLETWYPKALDFDSGGFFSDFDYVFELKSSPQKKFIVTQSRHLWSNSIAHQLYPETEHYSIGMKLGFQFLRDKMWDKEYGGFYQLVNRSGQPIAEASSTKTAYGNSFAIYALAAYFASSQDSAGLDLAIRTFNWLEKHSHDKDHKGYFQHLDREGKPIKRPIDEPTTSDIGYKDQNSSIHLLEAFTALYEVWKDPLLKMRLEEMFFLVRDQITHDRGHLILFFEADWTPVSFADQEEEVILQHRKLDHISFGHDVETAFLLMEAAQTLGLGDDPVTLAKSKKMLDHALEFGWDRELGGFYDEGYYFGEEAVPRIIKDSKNWWAQAEGMNAILMMGLYFSDGPNDYLNKFQKQWAYIDAYLVDHENGDWYSGGKDKQPSIVKADKGHAWKGNYHQVRSLKHSIKMLEKLH